MEQLSQPRNNNITIRITKNEKNEFSDLANKNFTTESNWAYNILVNHKNSYGKIKDIDTLIASIKVAKNGLELAREILKSQIKNQTKLFLKKETEIFMKVSDIFIEIQKLTKLQKQLEQLKE
jgi:hypothetical protein